MFVKDQTGIQDPGVPGYITDRNISKRMGLLLLNSVLRFGLQIIIIIVFARELTYSDYGTYQSVWLYSNVISVISLFGLPSILLSAGVTNVTSWIKNNARQSTLAFLLLYVLPVLYILFSNHLFSGNIKILLIVLIILQNISVISETLAIKNINEPLVLIVNIVFSAAYLICHLSVLQEYSLERLLSSLCFVFALKSLLLLFFSRKHSGSTTETNAYGTGKQWLYLGLFDVVSVIFKWVDKWFVLFFVSVTGFAVYFNGAYEIPVFALLMSAAGNIMVVELAKQTAIIPESINTIFNRTFIFLAGIIFPSFAFLLFYHYEFFLLIFSEKYIDSIPVFLVTIFVIPVRICNYTAALQVYNRNNIILKGAILDLVVAVLLIVILYPLFDLPGVAAAFVLSTYIQVGYYLYHTYKLTGEKVASFVPVAELVKILLFSLVVTGAIYYLSLHIILQWNLFAGVIICLLLICFFVFRFFKQRL